MAKELTRIEKRVIFNRISDSVRSEMSKKEMEVAELAKNYSQELYAFYLREAQSILQPPLKKVSPRKVPLEDVTEEDIKTKPVVIPVATPVKDYTPKAGEQTSKAVEQPFKDKKK